MTQSFSSFKEFWPHYVMQHRKRRTQMWHVVGTCAAVVWLVSCIYLGSYRMALLAIVIGYGPAISSHFLFEGNKPASSYAPVYSFLADFKLVGLVLAGRMPAEQERIEAMYAGASSTE